MTRIESIIALLKANTGAATVAPSLIASYANLAETTTLETISSTIMAGSILKPGFEIAPAADVIEQMFISLFGYSQTEMDELRATEAGAAGFQYWVDELNNNVDIINVNTLAIALLNGAAEADQAKAAALVADELAAYEAYAGETPEEPEVVGETFELTSGTDKGAAFVGTINNDFYDASIAQNSFTGGVSNTLSSADKLDGGAGTDTLHAELVAEFVGATSGDYQIDVQPQTKDIEIVTFEARDSGSNDTKTVTIKDEHGDITGTEEISANSLVTVDAKYMYGVNKIGSKFSDGDLVIENLTTLADDGETIRHTSEMTITMDHTDSMNSDKDASDLTVYFDEDYLNRTTDSQGSTLTINMINTLNLELNDGSSLIEGFEKLTFSVDGQLITVDVSGAELDAVQGLIEAALATAGFNDITVSTYTEEAYFGTNIYHQATNTTYPAGEYAGTYTAFLLTNSGSEELTEGGFTITDGQNDGSLAYSQNDSESTVVDLPISINVELNKVGRDGDGGNLIIGGKDTTGPDKDVDQNDGIEEFNITVLGNEDKPSNLGTITSTNDALKTVTVKSETRTDGSYAALTVRGEGTDDNPFGGTLTTFDANAFKGDLNIGEVVDALNIDTFTAQGGGDVTLNETIDGTEDGVDYTVTTGNGSDTLNITLDGDAVDTIGESFALNAGNGDNTVTVDMQGAGVSVATTAELDNLSITTGSGEDKVTLIGGTTDAAGLANAAAAQAAADAAAAADATAAAEAATLITITNGVAALNAAISNIAFDTDESTTEGALATLLAAAVTAGTITNADATVIQGAFDAQQGVDNTTTAAAISAAQTALGANNNIDDQTIIANNAQTTANATDAVALQTIADNAAAAVIAGPAKDGDADFTITTGDSSDFVYINSIDDIDSADAAKGSWTVGSATAGIPDFADTVLYKAELTVSFAGFESTVKIDTNSSDNFIATQVEINEAIIAAIAANPELERLLTTELGTGSQELTIESVVEGLNDLSITVNQPNVVASLSTNVETAAGQVVLGSGDATALLKGLLELGAAGITSSSDNNAVMNAVNTFVEAVEGKIIDDTTANVDTGSSGNETAVTNVSTIDLGDGSNDLVVLNSHDDSANTIVFSDDFGKVSVVNYFTALTATGEYSEAGTLGAHLLDFTAFLTNTEDNSANTNNLSEARIATTFSTGAEVDANSVHMFTFAQDLKTSTTVSDDQTWDGLTANILLAAIQNDVATTTKYGNIDDATLDNTNDYANTLVQTSIKSIVMIENDQNLGEYKVFELTASETTNEFTAANLVGIVDFGASIDRTDFDANDLV